MEFKSEMKYEVMTKPHRINGPRGSRLKRIVTTYTAGGSLSLPDHTHKPVLNHLFKRYSVTGVPLAPNYVSYLFMCWLKSCQIQV